MWLSTVRTEGMSLSATAICDDRVRGGIDSRDEVTDTFESA
jgi:hypothetical protein